MTSAFHVLQLTQNAFLAIPRLNSPRPAKGATGLPQATTPKKGGVGGRGEKAIGFSFIIISVSGRGEGMMPNTQLVARKYILAILFYNSFAR